MKTALILILTSVLSSCGVMSIISTAKTLITTDLDRRAIGAIADDELVDLSLEAWAINDKKLKNTHLNFNLYNQHLLITGEASSIETKKYIMSYISLNYEKIINIKESIRITQVSSLFDRAKDKLIDGALKIAFNAQEVFNPVHINYHTENTIVYLMGDVTSREGKKAGLVAARVSGVSGVIKYFNYIDKIPQREIVRAKEREARRIKEALQNGTTTERHLVFIKEKNVE